MQAGSPSFARPTQRRHAATPLPSAPYLAYLLLFSLYAENCAAGVDKETNTLEGRGGRVGLVGHPAVVREAGQKKSCCSCFCDYTQPTEQTRD